MQKSANNASKIFIAVIILVTFAFIGFLISQLSNTTAAIDYSQYSSKSVSLDNGVQIISMVANTGYSPNKILAQANIPNKLRIETKNTYDCTSELNIPSLNIKRSLPATGVTDIDIPSQIMGSTLQGYCGASTYEFQIKFS